jgi:LysR family transcriptional regulator, chromosome initiation inhibitor
MQIDSRQLAAFDAVLREGSFEAAARALHVTPSAISQRIKGLEERLGQVLVQRGVPCVAAPAGAALQRHAQQLRLLEAEALQTFGLGQAPGGAALPLAIAVNADSLATWFLPALARLAEAQAVQYELHVEDQDHSGALLRQGRVIAAVTAEPQPVQGCRAEPLGAMPYRAVASPAFMARHFAGGVDAASLTRAPCLIYNRKDALQARWLQDLAGEPLDPPHHEVPSTHGFLQAVLLGLGWGMNPHDLVAGPLARGELVELLPGRVQAVALYWQHWRLESPVITALTEQVRRAACEALSLPRTGQPIT